MIKRKGITKGEIVKAIQGLVNHTQIMSSRLDDIDRVVGDYITYKGDIKKFGDFLDEKYKPNDEEE